MSQNRDIRVILDDVPPRLNVTNPPEGLVTNQTLIWVCGTTDVDARLTVDGSAVKNDNGTFNISYWLDEGNNTISVVAWDDSGNNKEVRCNVTCLTTPPMLQITEPSEMALTNHNPVTVRGKTNGTRLEVDATPVPISKSGDFTYSWNVSGEGKRTVTAIAWDIAGNSRMVKRTIIYDITPPAIEILSPQNGSWLRSETAEVRLRSPEAVMMNAGGISIDPDGTGLAEFRTALKEGANRVPISAWDAAGNENTTILILYLDTSIFLEVTEPHGDALINHSDVTFRGRTESGAAVTVNGTAVDNKDGQFEYTMRLPDGKNRITVSSNDRAGNTASRTFILEVDTVTPAIEVLSPLESSVRTQGVRLRIRSEAGSNVTVNGQAAALEGIDTFHFDASLLQGDNPFKIRAVDAAGNAAVKEWSVVYVPPSKPGNGGGVSGLEPPLAALLAIIVASTLAAAVMLRRRKKAV